MSQAIRTELFDIAPELQSAVQADLDKIDRFIARAQKHVNADIVGDEYNLLVAYKTAELMTLAKPGSQSAGASVLLEEKVDNAHYKFANSDEAKAKRAKEFADEFEKRIGEIIYIEEGPV